jgi:ketosteroid isomerase-like protein
MSDRHRDAAAVVDAYWTACEARDWDAFGALLAEDVTYDMPQTRERIHGRPDYLRFNREYPAGWHVAAVRVVGQDRRAASWIDMRVGDELQTGISFFEFDESGLIARITDFWPTPDEPPPGREHLVERY